MYKTYCKSCKCDHSNKTCEEYKNEINEEIQKIKDQELYDSLNALPSEYTSSYWIYYGNVSQSHGKWMLYYDKKDIDNIWIKFKKLYDSNMLNGIIGMKVSGSLHNPRANDINQHVIILYCKEEINENIILIGKNILQYIPDYKHNDIYYKTNQQTRQGTVATGSNNNHLIKLKVYENMCNFLDCE